MKILALETSAKSVSCAVVEDGAPLASAYQCTGLTHSRTLLPMVDAMLKNADLTLDDINAIAIAAGILKTRAASKCPQCGQHKLQRSNSVLVSRHNGVRTEDVTYTCRNCGHKVVRRQQSYDENYRAGGGGGPVIFGGGFGRGSFGGGGGFSGGSFGGGMGGGGGAGSRF